MQPEDEHPPRQDTARLIREGVTLMIKAEI
jgi:hypothetical protein